jgi:hypothetical protein
MGCGRFLPLFPILLAHEEDAIRVRSLQDNKHKKKDKPFLFIQHKLFIEE